MPLHMTPAERDECIDLFRSGITADALADRYDRDYRTIQRLVARRGAYRNMLVDSP